MMCSTQTLVVHHAKTRFLIERLLRTLSRSVSKKSAETVLVENDVIRLGGEVRYDLCVPRVPDENPACASIRGGDCLARSKWPVLDPVWSIGETRIRKIRSETHLQIDDGHSCFPRRIQHAGRRRHGR